MNIIDLRKSLRRSSVTQRITDRRKITYAFGSPEWLEYLKKTIWILQSLIVVRQTGAMTSDESLIVVNNTILNLVVLRKNMHGFFLPVQNEN